MTFSAVENDIRKKRLLWRCRRGTRELELLLFEYIDQHYETLSCDEIDTLHEFVEQDYNLLIQWLFGQQEPDNYNKYKSIIKAIRHTG